MTLVYNYATIPVFVILRPDTSIITTSVQNVKQFSELLEDNPATLSFHYPMVRL